jgi:hypothetical protein
VVYGFPTVTHWHATTRIQLLHSPASALPMTRCEPEDTCRNSLPQAGTDKGGGGVLTASDHSPSTRQHSPVGIGADAAAAEVPKARSMAAAQPLRVGIP